MLKLGFKYPLCVMLSILILLGTAPISISADEQTESITKIYTKEEVITLIEDIDYAHMNLSNFADSEDKISSANDAYDSLTESDKEAIPSNLKGDLAAATRRFESLKTTKKAIDLINAIGDDITLESESSIVAARNAYDALSKNGKKLVEKNVIVVENGEELKGEQVLESKENKLAELKKAANEALTPEDVVALIDAIGYKMNLENMAEYESRILKAREGYEALTEDEKALVPETNVQTLLGAERQLGILKDVKKTIDLIDAIGDEVTLDSENAIKAAEDSFNSLNKWGKKRVTNQTKLGEDLKEYNSLKKVVDLIEAIDYKMNLENMTEVAEKIENAREAYDALTEEQKVKIPETNVQTLLGAERQLGILKDVKKTIDLIDAIGDEVTLDSENAIKAAEDSFNSLNKWGKNHVTNQDKLFSAKEKLSKLKEESKHKEEHKENKPSYVIVNTCTR